MLGFVRNMNIFWSILVSKLLKQGYSSRKLQTTFRKFYGRHTDLVSDSPMFGICCRNTTGKVYPGSPHGFLSFDLYILVSMICFNCSLNLNCVWQKFIKKFSNGRIMRKCNFGRILHGSDMQMSLDLMPPPGHWSWSRDEALDYRAMGHGHGVTQLMGHGHGVTQLTITA